MPDPHTIDRAPAGDPHRTRSLADPDATTGGDAPPPAPIPAPASADRYLLGEEIARGGMGVVYRAADTAFGREVAVKVLQDRFGPASAAARRFVEEARITGRLEHPAIPPAHDVGVLPDGRPFLAMKLIRGDTLDALLNRRPDPAADRGRFVAIFEHVCQAVAFAHARGIVHRDLKPHNVMVGAFGEVQVMDWGLAKVLGEPRGVNPRADAPDPDEPPDADPDRTTDHRGAGDATDDRTQAGQALGTPAYMPPEQARGDLDRIDRRADVFALGATLCEILTGAPPYGRVATGVVLARAAGGTLSPAFAELDGCGADPELVALCKRCLATDPADRPADAAAVAGLVAAHREAVEGRLRSAERERAAAEAKAAEQRKRRRVQLALAAAGVLLATGAGGVAVWRADEAGRQRAEGERRAGEESARRVRVAEAVADLLDRAKERLEAGDADRAAPFLDQAARRADEDGAADLAGRLVAYRRDLAMLHALDVVDNYRWNAQGSLYPPNDQVAARWAAAFAGYGIEPGVTPPAEAAARVRGSPIRSALVAALDDWLVRLRQDRREPVRMILAAADPDPFRDEVRRLLAADDRPALAALAGRPEWTAQPAELARAYAASPAARAEVRTLLARVAAARPAEFGLLMSLGETYPVNTPDGAGDRARWFQAAVGLRPTNSVAHSNLGVALKDQGDLDGAIREFREAIRLDPASVNAHNNLGAALHAKGDFNGAIAAFEEVLRRAPGWAFAHASLGLALHGKGELDEAIRQYREAIRLEPKYALPHNSLGFALKDQGDLGGAIREFREAIRLDPRMANAHANLGNALGAQGKYDEAIACYRAVIRLDPAGAPGARLRLAQVLAAKGAPAAAAAELREAVSLYPKVAQVHDDLARLLAAGPDGARDGRRAVEHATRACELTGWKTPDFIDTLAAAYAAAGDFGKAVEFQKKALSFPAFEQVKGPQARGQLALYEQKKPYRDPALQPREVIPPPRLVE
jgi:tetratricopeptide (TPR) repeat protein